MLLIASFDLCTRTQVWNDTFPVPEPMYMFLLIICNSFCLCRCNKFLPAKYTDLVYFSAMYVSLTGDYVYILCIWMQVACVQQTKRTHDQLYFISHALYACVPFYLTSVLHSFQSRTIWPWNSTRLCKHQLLCTFWYFHVFTPVKVRLFA